MIINKEVLEALGSARVLINVERGSVVDEPALIEGLKQDRTYLAGLRCLRQRAGGAARSCRDGPRCAVPTSCRSGLGSTPTRRWTN